MHTDAKSPLPLIYLAGPINGCTDQEATSWRQQVKSIHPHCLDPMDRDYRGKESENVATIVEGDKADIDKCDGMLVFFEKPSVGTSMEVLYAYERGTPVVIVNVSGKPLSPWLVYHSKAQLTNIPAAIKVLID